MTKILRVDDDVHAIIVRLAKEDDRNITPWLNRHFREFGETGTIPEKYAPPKNTNRVKPENCTCKYPEVILRNGSGHSEGCPCYFPIGHVPEKNVRSAEPKSVEVGDLFSADPELPCCKNELQPCKHWRWDTNTGEGYVNVLSGRYKVAE